MTSLNVPEAVSKLAEGNEEAEEVCCRLYEACGSKSLEILGELGIREADITLLFGKCRKDYGRMNQSLNDGTALKKIQQAKLLTTLFKTPA